jgi:two-component system, NarL family, invasion response regulator UvrY
VLLVDDHAMIRAGVKLTLTKAFSNVEVGEAETARKGLDLVRKSHWDIVILDIAMPGRSGLEVLPDIRMARPQLPVLIMSMHREDHFAVRALKAGASGFISKNANPKEFVGAVRKILSGSMYVSAAVSQALVQELGRPSDRPPHEQLSERELQVMCMLASGKSNKDVATELCISAKTVSTYRSRILEKMKFRTTAEITRYALKSGLVD